MTDNPPPVATVQPATLERRLGLFGSTMVGVGAMVGAGIFVLAGVAMKNAGPGAMIAFAANGVVAAITAFAFAELAASFPESGGGYVFARKVLPIGGAFAAGWTLWFAYVVACALYSLGFATFVGYGVEALLGVDLGRWFKPACGAAVAGQAMAMLYFRGAGAGGAVTVLKMVAFAILIVVGLVVLFARPAGTVAAGFEPMLPQGAVGVAVAMGYTFIALEGFEIIAAVGEEVKEPSRNIPRAMFLSIGITMVVYLGLLFCVLTVGGAGEGEPAWKELGDAGDVAMVVAAKRYAGPIGEVVVVAAGILSTLSALASTLLAASRVSFSMARDRALPRGLATIGGKAGTPTTAVFVSGGLIIAVILLAQDVDIAGAAASLVFLLSFSFANAAGLLVRLRVGALEGGYKAPLYPFMPLLGITACVGLALFQASIVPLASVIVLAWLGIGWVLYALFFRSSAETVAARAETYDPSLVKLRGRAPLVLVPLANPERADTLFRFAHAMATPGVGRVLTLTVARYAEDDPPHRGVEAYDRAHEAARRAVEDACETHRAFEGVTLLAPDVGKAIQATVRERSPEMVMLGMSSLDDPAGTALLDELLSTTTADVAVLQAPPHWSLDSVKHVLVPVGGEVRHHPARARVLGMLLRRGPDRRATLLRVIPTGGDRERAAQVLRISADDLGLAPESCAVAEADDALAEVVRRSKEADLIILGLGRREGGREPLIGDFVRHLAARSSCPVVAIAQAR